MKEEGLSHSDAEAICEAVGLTEPGPAVEMAPAELRSRLPEARERMAEVACYHGAANYWGLWSSLVGVLGEAPAQAAQRLSHSQAYWLARWCFDNVQPALGFVAYEHHLRRTGEPGNEIANNSFSNFIYFAEAMRAGQPARAVAAFGPIREQFGCEASNEVMFTALRVLAGEMERDALRAVVERFRRSHHALVHAACAIAFDALGDEVGVDAALAPLSSESVFSDSILRLLRERLGSRFAEALKRRPTPKAKTKRLAGMIATPGKRRSGHSFAPDLASGAACPGCHHPLRIWFSFDLEKVSMLRKRLPSWTSFDVPACFDCSHWMLEHTYVVEAGRIALEDVEPSHDMAQAVSDHAAHPIATQHVKLVKAPKDLDERPLDGHCQVGGSPAWIQDPVDVTCPPCNEAMVFVFRFSAPNDFAGCPPVAGESGALYYFACPTCTRFTQLAQWT